MQKKVVVIASILVLSTLLIAVWINNNLGSNAVSPHTTATPMTLPDVTSVPNNLQFTVTLMGEIENVTVSRNSGELITVYPSDSPKTFSFTVGDTLTFHGYAPAGLAVMWDPGDPTFGAGGISPQAVNPLIMQDVSRSFTLYVTTYS